VQHDVYCVRLQMRSLYKNCNIRQTTLTTPVKVRKFTDSDGISKHRLAPYNGYYLLLNQLFSLFCLFPVPVELRQTAQPRQHIHQVFKFADDTYLVISAANKGHRDR